MKILEKNKKGEISEWSNKKTDIPLYFYIAYLEIVSSEKIALQ